MFASFIFIATSADSQGKDGFWNRKIESLKEKRFKAQESSAAASLHSIVAAEIVYRLDHSKYASLETLSNENPALIEGKLAGGSNLGYTFIVRTNEGNNFYAVALPIDKSRKQHTFYIDEDGFLCKSDNVNAPVPIEHVEDGCPAGFTEEE